MLEFTRTNCNSTAATSSPLSTDEGMREQNDYEMQRQLAEFQALLQDAIESSSGTMESPRGRYVVYLDDLPRTPSKPLSLLNVERSIGQS